MYVVEKFVGIANHSSSGIFTNIGMAPMLVRELAGRDDTAIIPIGNGLYEEIDYQGKLVADYQVIKLDGNLRQRFEHLKQMFKQ